MANEGGYTLEKSFTTRNSILTDMWFKDPTPFHLALLAILLFWINRLVKTSYEDEGINLGFQNIVIGFTNLHLALVGWTILLSMSIGVFYFFFAWTKMRQFFPPNSKFKKFDMSCIALLILYYAIWFYLPINFISNFKLLPPLASALLLEQIRLSMKAYSFLREIIPKVLNYKPHSDKEINLPTFRQYIYFLFAPTLIYMDKYPRTPKIRLNYVLFYLGEILGIIYLFSLLFDTFLFHQIRDFDCDKYNQNGISLILFQNCFIGFAVVALSHGVVFHSTQNLFAELLTFGDRLFYTDWWASIGTIDFFRKWNLIVGKWLYIYIYKEFRELGLNTQLGRILVFFVSNIMHEWVFGFTFGFYSVIYTIQFILGITFYFFPFPKNAIFNIVTLYILALTGSVFCTLYGIEYYARFDDTIQNNVQRNSFIPKFFTC